MLPDVVDDGELLEPVPDWIAALPSASREEMGETWLGDARSEWASVPAFAELALHLAAAGAPTRLVADAHRAALDEVRHSQRCLELASLLLGRRLSLSAMPEVAGRRVAGRWWWSRRRHLVRLAVGSLIDGCVSEGNSAEHLRDRARATVPEVACVATSLASDEDRHTDLAWQIVAWCRAKGGAVVDKALGRALDRLPWTDGLIDSARERLAGSPVVEEMVR